MPELAPGRNGGPQRGVHTGVGFRGGTMLEQSLPEGLYLMEGTHTTAVLEELQPMGRTHVVQFMKDSILWEGPHAGKEEECEEEGAAETTCDELTATPIPHPPAMLRGSK